MLLGVSNGRREISIDSIGSKEYLKGILETVLHENPLPCGPLCKYFSPTLGASPLEHHDRVYLCNDNDDDIDQLRYHFSLTYSELQPLSRQSISAIF